MNMIMDTIHHPHHHPRSGHTSPSTPPVQRTDLHITTTPPTSPVHGAIHQQTNLNNNNNNHNNNIESQISPTTVPVVSNKSTLKRSFDVAFLMMPDDRIKQKQQLAEKQARLAEVITERHQYPTDLSPRSQQHLQLQQQHQQQQHHLHLHQLQQSALPDPTTASSEFFGIQEARRYAQISMRSPRIYDDPTVIIPAAAAAAAVIDPHETQPLKSAFTKVTAATRLANESPVPPLSPDQLSCPSMSPPVATTPPRTNSGNGSLSNGSSSSAPPCLNPNIVYQNFRPAEYQFNGAFQSVNQVQALQAHRIKQQLFYRPPLSAAALASVNGGSNMPHGSQTAIHPPEFLPGYPGFPFPGTTAPFAAAVTSPELPRIVQNPAAAAILSTLIPPTLASTFSLTAQNVCAKCNISFRMTSDLVYHMRSHHKSEVACDPNRRKREEKLKCPVCQESFRERHHLTRHMTAHQDKESDQILSSPATDSSSNNGPGSHPMLNGGVRHHNSARLAGIPK